MLLHRAVPPGPASSPESIYTGLRLGDTAGADRPYVICNFVCSADGKATAAGRTATLGGEGDRAIFHLLRTQVDAVLAGTGTLRVERYGALVRSEEMIAIRRREGRPAQPLAVVISRSGAIPFDIPLFADSRSEVAVYAPSGTMAPDIAAAVMMHQCASDDGGLSEVLRSLRHEHDIRALLCEGGPAIFNSMLAEDLVDELFLTVAPTLVGGEEHPITSGPALTAAVPLALGWVLERDGHLFLRYRRPDEPGRVRNPDPGKD